VETFRVEASKLTAQLIKELEKGELGSFNSIVYFMQMDDLSSSLFPPKELDLII